MPRRRIDYGQVTAILRFAEIVDIRTTRLNGRTIVAKGGPFGDKTLHYSTGKLEWAIQSCGDVYVIAASLTVPRDCDNWWVSQLKRGNAIYGPDRMDSARLGTHQAAALPWRKLFQKIGMDFLPRSPEEAQQALRRNSKFILGENIRPAP